MKSSIKIFFVLPIATLFFACDRVASVWKQEQPLAAVENKKLYMADVKDMFPPDITAEDSLAILHSCVDTWVKKMLMLRLAEENLDSKQKNVSALLEDYLTSLLVYRYEQKYIDRIDTAVSEAECESFYNENKQHFILTRPVVRVLFIKLRQNSPYMERIKKLYTSKDPEDFTALEGLCLQAATKFDYYGDRWLTLDELAKELPLRQVGYEEMVARRMAIEVADSTYAYLVAIRDFRGRDAIAPIEYEHDNIKTMILNRRKKSMIQDLEQRVLQEAKQKNIVKIYVNN